MLVSNASTLILLAKASILQEFLDNFKVVIPKEVFSEVVGNKDTFDSMLIRREIERGRINVGEIDGKKLKVMLQEFRLHEGEAAAYILFNDTKARAILTDDRELIKLCRIERTPFICSMAIIVRMYEKNLITKKNANDKLDRLYDYGRYSKGIYNYFKNEVK